MHNLSNSEIIWILNRQKNIFSDISSVRRKEIDVLVSQSKFLVIGAAGAIGRSVCREIFKRRANLLHAVDLNENNLVELVRSLRSEFGYKTKEFDTFAIDCGAKEFEEFVNSTNYDYIINLSAMKHVRNENNIFSMKRMIDTNIINAIAIQKASQKINAKKYFCVSTDKATNPANFMGATKRIMEHCLLSGTNDTPVSLARFANVAFSDGSLLDGFVSRLRNKQPITAPIDIKRYFITEEEAGQICLLSTLFASNGQIAIPLDFNEIKLIGFKEIVARFLELNGHSMRQCESEDEARKICFDGDYSSGWPVYLFKSDTTGEKKFEEFYSDSEKIMPSGISGLGFVQFNGSKEPLEVQAFLKNIQNFSLLQKDAKKKMISQFKEFLTNFDHQENHKFLNERM